MEKIKLLRIKYLTATTLIIASFGVVRLNAQVQIDHQIQLTGAGTNAKITGIKSVSGTTDAVSTDYLQRDSLKFATDVGSNNAYQVNLNPALANAYSVGMVVFFKAGFANTGPATLGVNALPQVTIKKNYNVDLVANDIKNGQAVAVMYDGASFQMLSQLGNASVGNHGKQIFSCTGADQYFYVPAGVTSIDVKLWGAGGGYANTYTGNSGGGGAFVRGTLTVTPGQILTIIVGQNGSYSTAAGVYGGGGTGVSSGSSGGGRSAIQISNGTDAITAAGGGGGDVGEISALYWGNGGGGGATTGVDGITGTTGDCANEGGHGATTFSGGAGGTSCTSPYNGTFPGSAGSQYKGANVNSSQGAYDGWGGGGGGGYYGGGSGASYYGGGGGGGASYYTNVGFALTTIEAGQTVPGGTEGPAAAGGTSDTDYPAGIGTGGASTFANSTTSVVAYSGNGLVVITY